MIDNLKQKGPHGIEVNFKFSEGLAKSFKIMLPNENFEQQCCISFRIQSLQQQLYLENDEEKDERS